MVGIGDRTSRINLETVEQPAQGTVESERAHRRRAEPHAHEQGRNDVAKNQRHGDRNKRRQHGNPTRNGAHIRGSALAITLGFERHDSGAGKSEAGELGDAFVVRDAAQRPPGHAEPNVGAGRRVADNKVGCDVGQQDLGRIDFECQNRRYPSEYRQ